MHGSPYHRGVEVRSPGVIFGDDGMILPSCRDVLATSIDAPMAEEAGHLRTHLLVALVSSVPCLFPIGSSVRVWHPSATIKLQSGVKLPLAQAGFVLGGNQPLVFVGEGFFPEDASVG